MLFMLPDKAMIQRVQGSYVSDAEIGRIVELVGCARSPGKPRTVRSREWRPWVGVLDRLDDEEELLADAIDAIRGEKSISATFVQRGAADLLSEGDAPCRGVGVEGLGGRGQGRRTGSEGYS